MGKKSPTLSRFEDAVAALMLNSLKVLPTSVGRLAGGGALRLGYHLHGKLRRTGLENLKRAFPELSDAQREELLKGEFDSLARLLVSASKFGSITRENFAEYIEPTKDEAFLTEYERIRASGRGRIIIGAHLGNWELLAYAYPMLYEPIHFLSRKLDNPLLEARLAGIRTRLGNVQIDKTNAAGPILRVLRKGGAVGILSDVNSSRDEGVFVPFFGTPASTSKGPAMLALRAGAVIVPMFGVWDKEKGKYVVEHGRILEPETTGDMEADVKRLTAAYTQEIEAVIRKYPDQWLWIHRRWKTRPEGEPSVYS